MNSSQIIQIIKENYHRQDGGWLLIPELRTGIGYLTDSMRKIDLYAFRIWESKKNIKFDRIAYEIKTSASDFYRDVADPMKQRPAIIAANRFYYVAPKGIIPIKSLPLDCGLIEITESLHPIITVPSAIFDYAPSWNFTAALVRAALDERKGL